MKFTNPRGLPAMEPADFYRFMRNTAYSLERMVLDEIAAKKAGDPEVRESLEDLEAQLAEIRAECRRLSH